MKKLLALSTFLFLLSTIIPPSAGASCWCSDATYCACANSKTTDYHINRLVGTNPASKVSQIATIYCDSQAELDSEFRQSMPVCGGSPEILPYCAYKKDTTLPDGIDTHSVTCYGIEFFKGQTNLTIPENKLQQMNGPVVFTYTDGSQVKFGDSGTNEVLWCKSVAFCCARSDIQCSDEEVPRVTADSYCTNSIPHLPNQTKASTCTPSSGAGESRLFFPHLKGISFLSTLLQTMFNPAPSSLSNNALPAPKNEPANVSNSDIVTTKIQYHQGLDDNTQIVNQKDNNSSLKVNTNAPPPLYNYNGTPPYKASAYCSIADTRVNPGDDLLGPKIKTALRYTQKYTYEAFPSANCVADSGETDSPALCCSNKAAGVPATKDGYFNPPYNKQERYKCGTLPGNRFKTEGRIAVFTKSPLVEYIYSTLVTGPQSVLKRIFPQGNPTEFKEIPGEAKYVATAPGADLLKVGSNSDTPTIYVPHLGSLYDYFLQGLQKALRPLGFSTLTQLPSPVGDCNNVATTITNVPDCKTGTGLVTHYACYSSDLRKIFESAGSAYNVAPDLLAAIASIESTNLVFEAPLDQPFYCQANECGAMGAMQLLTGYGVQSSCPQAQSDPSTANWAKYACKTNGQVPNPGNINDSIYSAASMISAMGIGSGANWNHDQVLELGYRYFGSKTKTYNRRASIDMANSCLDSSIKPIIYEDEMTYGDYLWYYYAPRNNKVITPPLPSPTSRNR